MGIGKGGGVKTAETRKHYALSDLLIPASEFKAANSTNVLVIGAPNSKKTFSMNSIPNEWEDWATGKVRPFNVLYINADDRASVIDWKARPHWQVVNLPLGGMNPLDIIHMHQDLIQGLSSEPGKFDCIIYDSLSVLSKNVDNFTWENVEGSGFSHGYEGNEDRFGKVTQLLDTVIFGLQQSAQFFFAIAHEKEPHFTETGVKAKFKPDLIGGIKNSLPKFFHEVYYTVQHEGEWHWLTQPQSKREPRTCYPVHRFLPMDWSIIVNKRWEEYRDENAAHDAEQAAEEAAAKEQREIAKAMSTPIKTEEL